MIVGLDVACRSDAIPAAPRAEICWSICVSVCILARRFNTTFVFFCAEHGSPCSFMLRHRSYLRAPGQSSICVWGEDPLTRYAIYSTRSVYLAAWTNTFSCGRSSSFCATTGDHTHGICERHKKKYKNKVLQDRLPPVLGAMHMATRVH